jgi:D-proline reductase (dithiol) PrdB
MSLTQVKGMQSEIFVPITPPSVWAPVTKPLKEMSIAIATAAGVHSKEQERFNLAGDFTWRKLDDKWPSSVYMVSHGGYDNGDVNKDINAMFPIDRLHELRDEGFIGGCAPYHAGFMGGGGDQDKFKHETGPAIAQMLKDENVDGVLMTAG